MSIRHLLPATAIEIAAQVGCTINQAHARLASLKRKGAAIRTTQLIDNGNTGRGAHRSALWILNNGGTRITANGDGLHI